MICWLRRMAHGAQRFGTRGRPLARALPFALLAVCCRDSIARAKCSPEQEIRSYRVVDVAYADGGDPVPWERIPTWAKQSQVELVARLDGVALLAQDTYLILDPE